MLLYRYTDLGDEQYVELHLNTYRVLRETPCTYLIEPTCRWESGKWPRRVYKTHPTNPTPRRFAYATIDDAWKSWCLRKHRQLRHKQNELRRIERTVAWLRQRAADEPPPVPLRRANAPVLDFPGLTLFSHPLEEL